MSTGQQRIAELAEQSKQMAFTNLAHHLSIGWLLHAYHATRQDGAPGVDGQTGADYGKDLLANLQDLLDRAKSGRYRAPPVRRVHIPKGTGRDTRPLGIPTFEDKVLQRAVLMLLEPLYEQDFLDCSYGFRPDRSAHQALEAVRQQTMGMGGCWLLEVDIQRFFDTLDHQHLRDFLQRRVRDGVVLRLIGKWLNAGVLEEGSVTAPESGTPQGGVASPLLANVYLHYVLDEWFEQEVKPRLRGRAFLVRYADDFVIGFEHESDALRVQEVLGKRFAKYGLTLHPEKTRLVRFVRPADQTKDSNQGKGARAGTFDLLGFTHYWGKSWRGKWVVKRKTSASRLRRAIRKVAQWCRENLHKPVAEQQQTLSQKLLGHYAYYGITGNARGLSRFLGQVRRLWKKWLGRRKRASRFTWPKYLELLKRYPLPPVKVVHSVYRGAANR
jgi:group II intron reverse transcriptase/maturase